MSPAQKVQIWIDIYGKPTAEINQHSMSDAWSAEQKRKTSSKSNGAVTAVTAQKSYTDVAKELNVSKPTVSRVVEAQDNESLKQKLREGEIEARAAQRAARKKIDNQQLKDFKEREEGKVPATWQGLYALAPKVNLITNILGQVTNGVDRWLTNEYGLDRIDPQGHTPLLITKTEQAIRALTKFKQALEDLRDEHK